MSSGIREALLNQILEFDSGASDLALIDMILERFLVVPRDQVTTEYGYRVTPRTLVLPRADLERAKFSAGVAMDYGNRAEAQVVQRYTVTLPWTVIPLPEDGDTDG